MDIKELPADRVTLKVFWEVVFTPAEDEVSLSDCTVDTASVSSRTSSSTSSCPRAEQWPAVFPIPDFSYDVEFRLQKENEVYEKTGRSALIVSREIKMEVLDKVAERIYSFKAYPTDADFESVAAALVRKHPCLKEPGPGTGWQGWKMSLKYKMGNYRQKLCTAGCLEVSVNKREKEMPQRGVKKPRHSEINFLPDIPHGFDDEALERERITLVEELRKKNVNMTLVNQKMDMTFSMRRREIVHDEPPVSVVMERWPGLFTEPQVYAEFKRITGIDLHTAFHASLDKFSVPLLKMYRAKESNMITALLESLDEQTTDMTKHRRITALKGLPYYIREHTPILKTCVAADLLETKVGMKMGILETTEDGAVPPKSRGREPV
nr:uncharacterized protein LOC111834473 [Paramormyrops kingsleyae]